MRFGEDLPFVCRNQLVRVPEVSRRCRPFVSPAQQTVTQNMSPSHLSPTTSLTGRETWPGAQHKNLLARRCVCSWSRCRVSPCFNTYLSPSTSASPTELLNQTLSFGTLGNGEPAGGGGGEQPQAYINDVGAAKPQRAAKAGSLDDILGTKMRLKATAEAKGASAASGGAAEAATPGNPNESAAAAPAAGGSRAGSVAEKIAPKKKRGSLDDILGIKVGKVVKGSTMKILQEGDAVEILTPPVGGGPSAFSPGVISRVHADGCVDVDLDTGGRLMQRPAKEVRVVRKLSVAGLAPKDLAVGDRVEAR